MYIPETRTDPWNLLLRATTWGNGACGACRRPPSVARRGARVPPGRLRRHPPRARRAHDCDPPEPPPHAHTTPGGWWVGGEHMIANPAFKDTIAAQLPKGGPGVVAVCQNGMRSRAACDQLGRMGYGPLAWVKGGLDDAKVGDMPTLPEGRDPRCAGGGEEGVGVVGGPRCGLRHAAWAAPRRTGGFGWSSVTACPNC